MKSPRGQWVNSLLKKDRRLCTVFQSRDGLLFRWRCWWWVVLWWSGHLTRGWHSGGWPTPPSMWDGQLFLHYLPNLRQCSTQSSTPAPMLNSARQLCPYWVVHSVPIKSRIPTLTQSELVWRKFWGVPLEHSGTILCMRPANERRRYIVTSSPIGRVHTQNDSCTFKPTQNGQYILDDVFKCRFIDEKILIFWFKFHWR